jgi:hypothetical protein
MFKLCSELRLLAALKRNLGRNLWAIKLEIVDKTRMSTLGLPPSSICVKKWLFAERWRVDN